MDASRPQTTNPEPPALLPAEGVAVLLSVGRAHVWKLLASGRLPEPLKLGRATRWRRDELLAWIEAGAPTRDRWQWTPI